MTKGEMGPMKLGPSTPEIEALGPGVIGALNSVPVVAQALGHFIAQLSTFEIALTGLGRHVAGQGGPLLLVAFGRTLSVSTRIDIIGDLILEREATLGPEMVAKCRDLVVEARRINARRNAFVHGTYTVFPKVQAVSLTAWWLSSGRANKGEWVNADIINVEALAILKFAGSVMAVAGQDVTPLSEEQRDLWKYPTVPEQAG